MNVEEKDHPIKTHKELIGKILDYWFLVKLEEEPVDDIKPNVDSHLVGEIIKDENVEETNEKKDYDDKPVTNRVGFKHHCNQCTCVFKNEWALNSHKNASHNKIIYSCDKCDFETNNKHCRKRHIKRIHEGKIPVTKKSKTYTCFQCDFNTPNKYFLFEHEKLIHGNNDKTFVCNKSGYKTNKRKNLRSHSFTHHNLAYRCDLCPFKSLSPEYVKRHKDRFHH